MKTIKYFEHTKSNILYKYFIVALLIVCNFYCEGKQAYLASVTIVLPANTIQRNIKTNNPKADTGILNEVPHPSDQFSVLDDDWPFSTNSDRNHPDKWAKADGKIITCRKLTTKLPDFKINDNGQYERLGLSALVDSGVNFNTKQASAIINRTWAKHDTNLVELVYRFAQIDSLRKADNYSAILCLSSFNTARTKNLLLKLLKCKDYRAGILSAASLIMLDCLPQMSFDFIKKNYSMESWPFDFYYVHTALMKLNTPQAIEFLKKQASNYDIPSCALDALGALALLGYCDYANKGFLLFKDDRFFNIRVCSAWCLAYYIGTFEAFKEIKEMYTKETLPQVHKELNEIVKLYNIK